MSRMPITLRQATAGDVPFLVALWGEDVLRRTDREEQVTDLELVVKEALESAEQRLLLAEYDGEPAGAVLLRVTTLSPLNLEPSVQALAPHVAPSFRRRGIGKVLMDAAVTWAEELGIGHVATAAASSSRAGNRFMARLSLGPKAVLRSSPTHAVRAQLTALNPAAPRVAGRRPLNQVLVARRQMSRRTPLT
jgi:ribosomal protein S18 acetylase RimI-like enzyme